MGPDLFRLVSVLRVGSSLVGGRVQLLLLRTDQTKHLDFSGSFYLIHQEEGSFNTQFCMIVIGQSFDDSYLGLGITHSQPF